MQSFLVASSLFNLAAAADAVDRKPSGRAGWECRHNMYCLKEAGLELIKYEEPAGQSWNIAKCQEKCEEYGESCRMVDIHSYTGDFDYNQSTCVLYTIDNARNWNPDVPNPEKYGCHHLSSWMACQWVQGPSKAVENKSSDKPAQDETKFQKQDVKSDDPQKNPNSNLVPNMAKDKSVDRKPSGRIGWECRYNMYCLKEDGLELIKYDEGSGSNWNIAKCQQKCEEYGEGCVMVDIQSYTSDFDYNQAYCVLYTIENARNWGPDVPEPEKYGCRHHTQWMTCAHNGKSLLI